MCMRFFSACTCHVINTTTILKKTTTSRRRGELMFMFVCLRRRWCIIIPTGGVIVLFLPSSFSYTMRDTYTTKYVYIHLIYSVKNACIVRTTSVDVSSTRNQKSLFFFLSFFLHSSSLKSRLSVSIKREALYLSI